MKTIVTDRSEYEANFSELLLEHICDNQQGKFIFRPWVLPPAKLVLILKDLHQQGYRAFFEQSCKKIRNESI